MKAKFGGSELELVEGDITVQEVDAIVNAANSRLAGGGGVDGAIHRAGGASIMAECDKIRARQGGCPTGKAVATGAGRLEAKWVIHAVGPVYRDGRSGEAELLASAYSESLKLAEKLGARSVAFPSLSTGAYGYPIDEAARVALRTISESLKFGSSVKTVRFVLFGRDAYEAFGRALESMSDVP